MPRTEPARETFHLRLYPTFPGDKLSKTTHCSSVFCQSAPGPAHIGQSSSVRNVGGASRQSEAFDGILPIFIASTRGVPSRSVGYPVPRKCGEKASAFQAQEATRRGRRLSPRLGGPVYFFGNLVSVGFEPRCVNR